MGILVVFVLYLIVLAAIGIYCARLNRTLADFVLGGRRLGAWVTALSAQASDMSAWLLIGLPAMAYTNGLAALWAAAGCAMGTAFNWMVVAPRLRRATGEADALTIPDFLAARFAGARGIPVRILAVLVILLAYAAYIAAQFIAAGKTFETAFSNVSTPWGTLKITYHTGMFVGVGIILLYTALGGFLAVAWTDFVQGLLMVATVVVLPIVGLVGLGGFPELWSRLHAANPHLLGVRGAEGATGMAFVMGVVVSQLSWGLGYPGQPHILVRFMALKDPKAMRRAAFIGITWVLLAMWGAIFVGLVGRATLGDLPDTDHVMPSLALGLMPPAVAGVMIAAAIAAMMSTVDSQLLVAASAVEQDIYIRLFGGRARDRRAVWFGRITVVALGAIAIPLAWSGKSVFDKVFDAWGVLAAGIGPVIILGLVSRRANTWGAAAGMLVGGFIAQFWTTVKPLFGGDTLFRNGLIPGFFLNLTVAYLLSLATGGRRRQDTTKET